jgi:multidrug efflux pump subunit AcrB
MSIASAAVQKRAITWFATIVLLLGGVFSFFQLGQLEDPEFTVKTAVVTTPYTGANRQD